MRAQDSEELKKSAQSLDNFKTYEKIFFSCDIGIFEDRQKISAHTLDKLVSFSKIFANIFTLRGERSNLAIGKRLMAPQKTKKYRIESDAEQNLQAQSVSRVLSRINIYLSQALPQGLSD